MIKHTTNITEQDFSDQVEKGALLIGLRKKLFTKENLFKHFHAISHSLIIGLTDNRGFCDGIKVREVLYNGESASINKIVWNFNIPGLRDIKESLLDSIKEEKKLLNKRYVGIQKRIRDNASLLLSIHGPVASEKAAEEYLLGLVNRLLAIYHVPEYPMAQEIVRKAIAAEALHQYEEARAA